MSLESSPSARRTCFSAAAESAEELLVIVAELARLECLRVCRPRRASQGSAAQGGLRAQAAPKVLVIGGPNGVGKLKLSLELAKRLNGEVISADALRIYHGLDIGTNKVSIEQQHGAFARAHMKDSKQFEFRLCFCRVRAPSLTEVLDARRCHSASIMEISPKATRVKCA